MVSIVHGGPDDGPVIRFDFSTNANPYGPPPALWDAVRNADRTRYPQPSYRRLRERLAAHHGVSPAQILPASGGSEAIRRISLAAALRGCVQAWVPRPGFGDYAAAATALGLEVCAYASMAQVRPHGRALVWACDPCNPTGASFGAAEWRAIAEAGAPPGSLLVVDQAYEGLRLEGRSELPEDVAAWRLQCPNKALGLTGVRAAYLVAPSPSDDDMMETVGRLAPSWVLSAEGEALLMQWPETATRIHLGEIRDRLRRDRATLRDALATLGWVQRDTVTPFWLAHPPGRDVASMLDALRAHGIKLRDATSFDLPGWVRVAAQPPQALDALVSALEGRCEHTRR